jgi:hypothetical protein
MELIDGLSYFPDENSQKRFYQIHYAFLKFLDENNYNNLIFVDKSARPFQYSLEKILNKTAPHKSYNYFSFNPHFFYDIYKENDIIDDSLYVDYIKSNPHFFNDSKGKSLIIDTCYHSGRSIGITESFFKKYYNDISLFSVLSPSYSIGDENLYYIYPSQLSEFVSMNSLDVEQNHKFFGLKYDYIDNNDKHAYFGLINNSKSFVSILNSNSVDYVEHKSNLDILIDVIINNSKFSLLDQKYDVKKY